MALEIFGLRIGLTRAFNQDTHVKDEYDEEEPSQASNMLEAFNKFLEVDNDRKKRYEMYEKMDKSDLVASAADLFAEDAATANPDTGKTLWVECGNAKIKNALEQMFTDVSINDLVYPVIRTIALMGDDFERVVYKSGDGVKALHYVEPSKMVRKEDKHKRLAGFMQDGKRFRTRNDTATNKTQSENVSYPWDYIHWRNTGRFRDYNGGISIFHNAIRPWKQLFIAENEALLYRLSRQPDRLVWKVDVGNQPEVDARSTVRKFKNKAKKREFLDPLSARYDYQHDPMTPMEDIFIGVRKGSETNVDKLQGSDNPGEIQDLRYYLDKFFSAIRTPKMFFGYESQIESVNPKQILTNQSVRYARTVQRLQNVFKTGMMDLCEIHLTLLDPSVENSQYDWRKKENAFRIIMEPVSYLAELERLELLNLRLSVAISMQQLGLNPAVSGMPVVDMYEWTLYIMKEVLHVSNDKIIQITKHPTKLPSIPGTDDVSVEGERIANAEYKNKDVTILIEMLRKNPELLRLIEVGKNLYAPDVDAPRRSTNYGKDINGVVEDSYEENGEPVVVTVSDK